MFDKKERESEDMRELVEEKERCGFGCRPKLARLKHFDNYVKPKIEQDQNKLG